MIDAKPGIAGEGITKILSECIDALAGVQLPQGVGPTLGDKQVVRFPHLGPEQRAIDPSFRRVDVEIGRHDIVVAGEHNRPAGRQRDLGMWCQPAEPAQLVIELPFPILPICVI
jgi:hypothetical protein